MVADWSSSASITIISYKQSDNRKRETETEHQHSTVNHNFFVRDLLLCLSNMGLEEGVLEIQSSKTEARQARTLCVHAFCDLTYISPVVFLYLMKECYIHGTCKATKKFQALQQQVHLVLGNAPHPGPATFVVQCLYVLPISGLYWEGFSHMIISALPCFLKTVTTLTDFLKAKKLAARLFLDIGAGSIDHDERVVVNMLEAFDIGLTNIDEVICQLKAQNCSRFDNAIAFVEQYIFGLIESESYRTAVTLLEHFSIRQSGQSFLLKMVQNKEFKASEKWATLMGKPMLCVLVHEYVERNMLKNAYETIKKNNLWSDFPDIYPKCNSSLKKLTEKGYWDVAETKANRDRQLLEYLVYLAMKAGYSEKVDELCDRYLLEGFVKVKDWLVVIGDGVADSRFLHLADLSVEDANWVDEVDWLRNAICHIEECKVMAIDCEWKPNYMRASKPNKVSIMQIASDKKVFIFDLIKLCEDAPDIFDNCLNRILQSHRILKLGYNFQCDAKQLARSYGELECFKHFEMLLDIQNVFKEPRGGLSGLAEKILGVGLNKTIRNSNWEQRPLSQNQLEYAALDAVVLIHIFRHICGHSQPPNVSDGHEKIEWKSHFVALTDNQKKFKKEYRGKKKLEVEPK